LVILPVLGLKKKIEEIYKKREEYEGVDASLVA
jgi:hypothetical protein